MKAVTLRKPGGLDQLKAAEMDDPIAPAASEILLRLHGSSLNYHDYAVATGKIPTEDGRIPLSDGAGVVEAVGDPVTEFGVGDHVVSCFFPLWQDGGPTVSDFSTTPGDGIDGYARERVVRPASWFTLAPKSYSPTEAATLTTAGLTAWRALVLDGQIKAGDSVLTLGTGGVSIFALQFAKMMGATVIATSSADEKLEQSRDKSSRGCAISMVPRFMMKRRCPSVASRPVATAASAAKPLSPSSPISAGSRLKPSPAISQSRGGRERQAEAWTFLQ
jgi:NADPH:quinone reductase-like Zn-dependent oxidoreductase